MPTGPSCSAPGLTRRGNILVVVLGVAVIMAWWVAASSEGIQRQFRRQERSAWSLIAARAAEAVAQRQELRLVQLATNGDPSAFAALTPSYGESWVEQTRVRWRIEPCQVADPPPAGDPTTDPTWQGRPFITTPPADPTAIPSEPQQANDIVYLYRIAAEGVVPGPGGGEALGRAQAIRYTAVNKAPLFRYVIFYAEKGPRGDLELSHGGDVQIRGNVHSNGSIYLGAGTGALDWTNVAASGMTVIGPTVGADGVLQTPTGVGAIQGDDKPVRVVGVDGVFRLPKPLMYATLNGFPAANQPGGFSTATAYSLTGGVTLDDSANYVVPLDLSSANAATSGGTRINPYRITDLSGLATRSSGATDLRTINGIDLPGSRDAGSSTLARDARDADRLSLYGSGGVSWKDSSTLAATFNGYVRSLATGGRSVSLNRSLSGRPFEAQQLDYDPATSAVDPPSDAIDEGAAEVVFRDAPTNSIEASGLYLSYALGASDGAGSASMTRLAARTGWTASAGGAPASKVGLVIRERSRPDHSFFTVLPSVVPSTSPDYMPYAYGKHLRPSTWPFTAVSVGSAGSDQFERYRFGGSLMFRAGVWPGNNPATSVYANNWYTNDNWRLIHLGTSAVPTSEFVSVQCRIGAISTLTTVANTQKVGLMLRDNGATATVSAASSATTAYEAICYSPARGFFVQRRDRAVTATALPAFYNGASALATSGGPGGGMVSGTPAAVTGTGTGTATSGSTYPDVAGSIVFTTESATFTISAYGRQSRVRTEWARKSAYNRLDATLVAGSYSSTAPNQTGFASSAPADTGNNKAQIYDPTTGLVTYPTANTTTLSGALSGAAATCTVASAANLAVGMLIQIDSEHLLIGGIAGTTLTVTRGANGTTAAAHSSGAGVRGHGTVSSVVSTLYGGPVSGVTYGQTLRFDTATVYNPAAQPSAPADLADNEVRYLDGATILGSSSTLAPSADQAFERKTVGTYAAGTAITVWTYASVPAGAALPAAIPAGHALAGTVLSVGAYGSNPNPADPTKTSGLAFPTPAALPTFANAKFSIQRSQTVDANPWTTRSGDWFPSAVPIYLPSLGSLTPPNGYSFRPDQWHENAGVAPNIYSTAPTSISTAQSIVTGNFTCADDVKPWGAGATPAHLWIALQRVDTDGDGAYAAAETKVRFLYYQGATAPASLAAYSPIYAADGVTEYQGDLAAFGSQLLIGACSQSGNTGSTNTTTVRLSDLALVRTTGTADATTWDASALPQMRAWLKSQYQVLFGTTDITADFFDYPTTYAGFLATEEWFYQNREFWSQSRWWNEAAEVPTTATVPARLIEKDPSGNGGSGSADNANNRANSLHRQLAAKTTVLNLDLANMQAYLRARTLSQASSSAVSGPLLQSSFNGLIYVARTNRAPFDDDLPDYRLGTDADANDNYDRPMYEGAADTTLVPSHAQYQDLPKIADATLGYYNGLATSGSSRVFPHQRPQDFHHGVKLVNAATVNWNYDGTNPDFGTTKLSVCTPNQLYIQGDLNSATSSVTQGGAVVNKHAPVAVMADAVTFLSPSWSDENQQIPGLTVDTFAVTGGGSLADANGPVATSSTIIASIVTHHQPTTRERAKFGESAAFVNTMLHLEDWSSATFSFTGSLVVINSRRHTRSFLLDQGKAYGRTPFGWTGFHARTAWGGTGWLDWCSTPGSAKAASASASVTYGGDERSVLNTSANTWGVVPGSLPAYFQPTRTLSFNDDLLSAEGTPPFTPYGVSVSGIGSNVNELR